jgi:DNA-binding NarL/FixJ family response regulator
LFKDRGASMISVLHIEDNEHIAEVMKEFMDAHNIFVKRRTRTYEETIEALKTDTYDVIIVDMCLYDDLEAGANIIKYVYVNTDYIRIIACSDYTESILVKKAINSGAVKYVPKHNLELLVSSIGDIMEYESPQMTLATAYREIIIRQKLTQEQNKIVDSYVKTNSIKSLADEFDIDEESVIRVFRRIKNRVKIDIDTLVKKYIYK